ncbi:MAG TPA: hypothetical protein VFE59_29750 [Trebonia sp.]|nr:hypothetical protein [Trebonia sp.]
MQARLLLVHSPLVGCGTWAPVAQALVGDRFAVTVPDLAGTLASGPLLATAGAMLGERVVGYVLSPAQPGMARCAG